MELSTYFSGPILLDYYNVHKTGGFLPIFFSTPIYLIERFSFHYRGLYNIYVNGQQLVGKCEDSGSFGELALMYNSK